MTINYHKVISREKGYAGHLLSVNKLVWNGNDLISVSDDKHVMIWKLQLDQAT